MRLARKAGHKKSSLQVGEDALADFGLDGRVREGSVIAAIRLNTHRRGHRADSQLVRSPAAQQVSLPTPVAFLLFARSNSDAPSGTMASAFAFHPPSRRVNKDYDILSLRSCGRGTRADMALDEGIVLHPVLVQRIAVEELDEQNMGRAHRH
jgi:hypothetical protein